MNVRCSADLIHVKNSQTAHPYTMLSDLSVWKDETRLVCWQSCPKRAYLYLYGIIAKDLIIAHKNTIRSILQNCAYNELHWCLEVGIFLISRA